MTRTLPTRALLAITAVALYILLIPASAKSEGDSGIEASSTPATSTPALLPSQEVWVQSLRQCESSGNDDAINKVDVDGTSSYGRFQFKPGTYQALIKRYALATSTNVLNGQEQEQIVDRMVLDKSISNHEWEYRQFPYCIQNKIGLPPRK